MSKARCIRCARPADGHGYDSEGFSAPAHDWTPGPITRVRMWWERRRVAP